jgi:biopolymer transport protein ExbD
MSWKLRHEGSPRAIEGLTPGQIAQGLLDGRWEPTDEVMGPQDTHWIALEEHPNFAAVALEVEPPPPKQEDDETRLDMNALIDVCLVLLVFFILTTSYAILQKLVTAPGVGEQGKDGSRLITQDQVDRAMIEVDVRQTPGDKGKMTTVYLVKEKHDEQAKPVEKADLVIKLKEISKRTGKKELLLDCDDWVPLRDVQGVRDDAAQADINLVRLKKKPK